MKFPRKMAEPTGGDGLASPCLKVLRLEEEKAVRLGSAVVRRPCDVAEQSRVAGNGIVKDLGIGEGKSKSKVCEMQNERMGDPR
jgi:hypothetical protein